MWTKFHEDAVVLEVSSRAQPTNFGGDGTTNINQMDLLDTFINYRVFFFLFVLIKAEKYIQQKDIMNADWWDENILWYLLLIWFLLWYWW